MAISTASKKSKLVRLLHVAKTQLLLSDEEYRLILANCSQGKTSSKNMSLKELEDALKQMKARGFVVTISQNGNKKDLPIVDSNSQVKMIRGLWLELYHLGVVRNSSELALAAFIKRLTGVEYQGWLDIDEASKVIEHLKKWKQRVE